MSKSNYQVAHEFAYGATHGKSANMFIDGDCIYSYGYHFCIAKRVNKDTMLFTTRGYSVTTTQHCSYVANAIGHLKKIYCAYPNGTHSQNFEAYIKEIEYIVPSLVKARKPELYTSKIHQIYTNARVYCEYFGLEMPEALQRYSSCQVSDEYLSELKRQETEKRKAKQAHIAESLRKWHNFESYYAPTLEYQELRVNKSKNRIETTMGVQIPFELGKKFYELLRSGKLSVGDSLMNYVVGKVSDTEVFVGCHKFKRKYLMDFGMGVFK